jgi:hypothetical protein
MQSIEYTKNYRVSQKTKLLTISQKPNEPNPTLTNQVVTNLSFKFGLLTLSVNFQHSVKNNAEKAEDLDVSKTVLGRLHWHWVSQNE